VDQLDCARGPFDLLFGQSNGTRGGKQQRGADAFAAAEHTVTHCFVQSRRARDRFGQPPPEGALHAPLPRSELFPESVRMRRAQVRVVTELRDAAHARLSNSSGSNSIIACWKAVPQERGSSA
jgi:hypothetical protein